MLFIIKKTSAYSAENLLYFQLKQKYYTKVNSLTLRNTIAYYKTLFLNLNHTEIHIVVVVHYTVA